MANSYEKLIEKLKEIFQLDQADLDFGIYRIMNQKRDEITRFLEQDLLPQVKDTFVQYQSANSSEVKAELDKLIHSIEDAGMNPEESPKVKEVRKKLSESVDISKLEDEVYSDLFSFFRRYYDEGDFISLRRYKEGVYSIPYEGEEVKLHWANADQYYIKTTENFRDYAFKLYSGKRVHFKLVDASVENDNNKAVSDNVRRFILSETTPICEENNELIIPFEYQSCERKSTQTDLNTEAVKRIFAAEGIHEWISEIAQKAPTEKNPNRTQLEKHLTQYTAKNTFDYFIHKDLGRFLRRELDFYIKNEVMHLDDIDTNPPLTSEQYSMRMSKIKAIRQIAHKIIDFLAQIENFQKKLWLKKKFVVKTNYCITLDRVPEELYPEIAANDAQREEWVHLFVIDEIKRDVINPGYSVPLTIDFLKENPFLVLDTIFFSPEFKDKLLCSIDEIDNQLDGLITHSENIQALHLLCNKYKKQVSCIYIDPPYNTGNDGFVYKDYYQFSSWNSLMHDRANCAASYLEQNGVFLCSIDDIQVAQLRLLLDQVFGSERFIAQLIWKSRQNKDNRNITNVSVDHEYVMAYGSSLRGSKRIVSQYSNPDNDPRGAWTSANMVDLLPENQRPNCHFDLVDPNTGINYGKPPLGWRYDGHTMQRLIDENRILWAATPEGRPRRKAFLSELKGDYTGFSSIMGDSVYTRDGTAELNSIFGSRVMSFPKPMRLISELAEQCIQENGIILDYFAGSGTTAHAVLNLNREDGGNRKYILVEMGDYFNTILKPRLQKVVYSKDWKDGKPVSRQGLSHMFKYIVLESYEDALNNLELKRTEQQQQLLEMNPEVKEDYLLRYMLDVESKGSASLLNIEDFEDPFNYKLKITTGDAGETRPTVVDLVETFNYLLGLTVHRISLREPLGADFERTDDGMLRVKGRTHKAKTDEHTYLIQDIEGTLPSGEKCLVIWRTLDDDKEKCNAVLESYLTKQRNVNPLDQEFGFIYVNGDNNLENLRKMDQTWKVRLIEEHFQKLMFDVED